MSNNNEKRLTIKDFQKIVDEWIRATDAGYFDELTNMAILTEETGEVARIIARRYGCQVSKSQDDDSLEKLAEELADVVRVVVALANQTGIDLEKALMSKHKKIQERDSTRFVAT